MMVELSIEIKIPRVAGKQMRRNNPRTQKVEEYYRITIFMPLVQAILSGLSILFYLNLLLPTKTETLFNADQTLLLLGAELSFWRPISPNFNSKAFRVKTFAQCDEDLFPTIKALLQLLCTYGVGNASMERSFSCLRRFKNSLRSNVGHDRLVGLAILNIHRNSDIIDKFSSK